ncbi:MAG: DNA methyltransferase [Chloroflexi bacterium]|nr:DNA methyltransferase [Chloroflexota bacterium]
MQKAREQLQLFSVESENKPRQSKINRLEEQDRAFHDWYRFVLSFPPHLVRQHLDEFGVDEQKLLLDPFCGTGTTLVEAKKNHISSVGLEANPFAQFASAVKVNWEIDPDLLLEQAQRIAETVQRKLQRRASATDGQSALRTLPSEAAKLLIRNSISPLPLHKALILRDEIQKYAAAPFCAHARLALANALVNSISNLRFGPEVGIGSIKHDVPVVRIWLDQVDKMVGDLRRVQAENYPAAKIHLADARELSMYLDPRSIDAVITSPPYPNEKDYTRTTRLESVILGFINNRAELRTLKKRLVRSNTRAVFKADDDDEWVRNYPEVERIAQEIEERRIALGKTSGFEKLYHRVTRLYFGGMARHLAELRPFLRPGAHLAYVVGDQASYFQVLIRTGELLGDIAESLGYELARIDLFRERFSTATRQYLREETVVLRWNGNKRTSLSFGQTHLDFCPP